MQVSTGSGIAPLYLKAQTAGDPEHELLTVTTSPFTVGRRADNDAQIPGPDVSGRHAVLEFDGGWLLRDNDSTNGTFFNGQRISQPVRLNVGDVVNFASRGYQVVARDPRARDVAVPTKILPDSSEIKGIVDLVRILSDGRTFAEFQPIMRLGSMRTVGYESLGRAVTGEGPITAGPLYFIAGKNKLEGRLSARFRESAHHCIACRHCWPRAGQTLLFFNLHPEELEDERLPQWLVDFQRADLRQWCRPVIELPESLCCHTDEMRRLVDKIRGHGLLVAFDDFGKGQSRIADLITVPPDFLKLDRELIASIGSQQVKHGLVKAVVDACRQLNVTVIGEGIETPEELEVCLAMGIELGQGYLLGRPTSPIRIFDVEPTSLPRSCPYVRFNMLPEITATRGS